MEIVRIPAHHVDKELAKTLKKLTLGNNGSMQSVFQGCRNLLGYRGIAFICYEGDEVVGWALRWRPAGQYYWQTDTKQWTCYFFVKPKYRRKGYGSALAEAATVAAPKKVRVYSWDTRSIKFFNSNRNKKIKILGH